MSPDITTNDLRDLRHRGPPSGRDLRLPRQLPSSSPKKPKQSRQSPKPIKVMSKCYSEPMIFQEVGDGDDDTGGCRSFDSGESGWLTRFHTLDDVLSCTPDFIDSPLSRINSGYEKDAKVLITVTVEGSPGPIRTLVKLGTRVEETIKLVVQKYGEEGRTPRLDKDSVSFDLHVSYFSLQSLDRSDAIGDAGSRTFYLRKNEKKCHEGNGAEVATTALSDSEIQYNDVNRSMLSPSKQVGPPVAAFPPFIAQKMNKFERRLLRFLKRVRREDMLPNLPHFSREFTAYGQWCIGSAHQGWNSSSVDQLILKPAMFICLDHSIVSRGKTSCMQLTVYAAKTKAIVKTRIMD